MCLEEEKKSKEKKNNKKKTITAEAEVKRRSRCRKISFKCSKEMKEW